MKSYKDADVTAPAKTIPPPNPAQFAQAQEALKAILEGKGNRPNMLIKRLEFIEKELDRAHETYRCLSTGESTDAGAERTAGARKYLKEVQEFFWNALETYYAEIPDAK